MFRWKDLLGAVQKKVLIPPTLTPPTQPLIPQQTTCQQPPTAQQTTFLLSTHPTQLFQAHQVYPPQVTTKKDLKGKKDIKYKLLKKMYKKRFNDALFKMS